ncbi:MAG TPA: DUF4070 domain-containing protein [Patescibacteria group bacterium]|nr:DUF4070 domain-containing protein [Patescibacteria group bacterium]
MAGSIFNVDDNFIGNKRKMKELLPPAEESLKEAQKMQNTHRSLLESVRRIQSYGMEVMAGFIVGFDNDPEGIFDRQVQFIQESAIPLAMVGLLQALPGTQPYRRLHKEGRLVGEGTGNSLNFYLSFIPRIGARQLLKGFGSILQRIFNPKNYYARVRHFLAQCQPNTRRRSLNLPDCRALARSVLRQGILNRGGGGVTAAVNGTDPKGALSLRA